MGVIPTLASWVGKLVGMGIVIETLVKDLPRTVGRLRLRVNLAYSQS